MQSSTVDRSSGTTGMKVRMAFGKLLYYTWETLNKLSFMIDTSNLWFIDAITQYASIQDESPNNTYKDIYLEKIIQS